LGHLVVSFLERASTMAPDELARKCGEPQSLALRSGG
jgi:hypothetical protein